MWRARRRQSAARVRRLAHTRQSPAQVAIPGHIHTGTSAWATTTEGSCATQNLSNKGTRSRSRGLGKRAYGAVVASGKSLRSVCVDPCERIRLGTWRKRTRGRLFTSWYLRKSSEYIYGSTQYISHSNIYIAAYINIYTALYIDCINSSEKSVTRSEKSVKYKVTIFTY